MRHETLLIAIELEKRINELEKIIANVKSQKCEWIEFTFGNGSNKANVCNDPKIIEHIRTVLLRENETKLSYLKQEFNNL